MSDSPDEQAVWLQRAFDEHRRELHVHCYRLAGNVTDADDLVQETFLRAWRARHRFEGRASARTWLYRIATNVFLDSRKAAGHRTLPYGDPLEWSTELGPYPDALLADDPAQAGRLFEAWFDPARLAAFQGSVVLLQRDKLLSMAGNQTYHVGKLPPLTAMRWFFGNHPLWLAVLVCVVSLLLALVARWLLRRRAAARLKATD